ncbi:MAG TPA: M20/M25/M40 family metallo-hydrolase [Jatrophihabitantaceae bacterium]
MPIANDFVAADRDRVLDEWGRIALLPAPLGGEERRAALIADLARASGADHVEIDRVGNVVTWLDGTAADGPTLTFLATMDDLESVAAHRSRSDVLYHADGCMVGPCVETTSSDATALALIRFAAAGQRPWRRLLIVFVLGEETGLTGVRALVDDFGADLGSVVDLMGGIGTVSWNALGFAGLEVSFTTSPRHTLYGGVSEVSDAIARFVRALHDAVPSGDDDLIAVRRVNRIHAGSVFNHSPETGTVSIDIRSVGPDTLDVLDADTRALAADAAEQAAVRVSIADGERQPAITLPGGREHPMVRALATAIREQGREPVLRPWSSSNINVVYAAGLSGIVHDGTFRGGGRGTADEWADIAGVLDGLAADCRLLQLLTEQS